MDDLIERLQAGCVYRPKRWSGDTHDDLGGPIDEAATDSLLAEAAAALEAAREDVERLDFLDSRRGDDVQPEPGSGDPVLVAHYWSVEGQCYDVRTAIDDAREARNG